MNRTFLSLFCFCAAATLPAEAAITATLSTAAASPSPSGSNIHWTASSTDAGPGATFRFSVTRPNGVTTVITDFDTSPEFDYMPMNDGAYSVIATIKSSAGEQASASRTYVASSLQTTASQPVVTATGNALIAIYSATCSSGSMRVFFAPSGSGVNPVLTGTGTSLQACVAGKSVNFLLAGMRGSTQYTIQHQVSSGLTLQNGPQVNFTTGTSPAFPPLATVAGITTAPEKVVLMSMIGIHGIQGWVAYDMGGNLIWYSDLPGRPATLYRPVAGGTLLVQNDPSDTFRELDLLGNTVHQTNITRLTEQVPASFPKIINFNHDAIKLPNGYTAFITGVERVFTDGTQGATPETPVDLLGDGIIVVDQDWQVKWTWDPFTRFDVTRPPLFTANCPAFGCSNVPTLMAVGIDWTHANSLLLTADNNFVMSFRHQDLLIKINYANGSGDGTVLWKLGAGGDFTVTNPNSDGYAWFSGQHSPTLKGNYLTVFDNGTTRVAPGVAYDFSPSLCCSRGQAWTINEADKTVTLVTNANLGTFSDIIGSSQALLNGNLHFLSGFAYGGYVSEVKEVTPSGAHVFTLSVPNSTYRAFRMRDLYTP